MKTSGTVPEIRRRILIYLFIFKYGVALTGGAGEVHTGGHPGLEPTPACHARSKNK